MPDGNEYEDSVTGFTLVTPVVHADEPEPPSLGRGVAPQATEDRGVRSFAKKIRTHPQGSAQLHSGRAIHRKALLWAG